jgi:hypothetical protein
MKNVPRRIAPARHLRSSHPGPALQRWCPGKDAVPLSSIEKLSPAVSRWVLAVVKMVYRRDPLAHDSGNREDPMKHWLNVLAAISLVATTSAQADGPTRKQVLSVANRVANWQLEHLDGLHIDSHMKEESRNPRSWQQGAFWVGMTHLAHVSGDQRYVDAILNMGRANNWSPGMRLTHADDHVIAQSYLWAARHGAGKDVTGPIRGNFDAILASPPVVHLSFAQDNGKIPCLQRWCWCDAVFMAPPAWLDLANQTDEPKYRDYAMSEFWAATDFLYDPAEKLYFRDSRFFERRDDKGHKLFWARGNGWVLAGIANMLDLLPRDHADRARPEPVQTDGWQAQGSAKARRLLGAVVAGPRKLTHRDQWHGLLCLWSRLGREPRIASERRIPAVNPSRMAGFDARGGEGRPPRLGATSQRPARAGRRNRHPVLRRGCLPARSQ